MTEPRRRVLGLAGWSGSGKTTLLVALVGALSARGISVSTVKHAHHAFDVDKPGKDSHRHREAGAREVVVSSANRWALMHELRGAPEATLDELMAMLAPVDLVIVEGYKRDRHPKVEAWRAETGQPLIAGEDDTVRVIASNDRPEGVAKPVIGLDDIPAIADFILGDLGLALRKSA